MSLEALSFLLVSGRAATEKASNQMVALENHTASPNKHGANAFDFRRCSIASALYCSNCYDARWLSPEHAWSQRFRCEHCQSTQRTPVACARLTDSTGFTPISVVRVVDNCQNKRQLH